MAGINQPLAVNNKAHDGYRRAGVAFTKGVTVFEAGHFTKDQLAMLEADPRLQVTLTDEGYPEERLEREREGIAEENPAAKTSEKEGTVADGSLELDLSGVPEELHEGLRKLFELDRAGELKLNKSGKPNADDLGVTAAVRDSLWATYQKLREEKGEQ